MQTKIVTSVEFKRAHFFKFRLFAYCLFMLNHAPLHTQSHTLVFAPLSTVTTIFLFSTLRLKSILQEFYLQDVQFVLQCSGNSCYFVSFFLLIISCFSRTIIVINTLHYHFTVLSLRQDINRYDFDAFEIQAGKKEIKSLLPLMLNSVVRSASITTRTKSA